jgi:hypothetical protein
MGASRSVRGLGGATASDARSSWPSALTTDFPGKTTAVSAVQQRPTIAGPSATAGHHNTISGTENTDSESDGMDAGGVTEEGGPAPVGWFVGQGVALDDDDRVDMPTHGGGEQPGDAAAEDHSLDHAGFSAPSNGLGDDRALAEQVCQACVVGLDIDGAAISLLTGSNSRETLWATDTTAELLEDLQFSLGKGACMEAALTGRPVLVPALTYTTAPRSAAGPSSRALSWSNRASRHCSRSPCSGEQRTSA